MNDLFLYLFKSCWGASMWAAGWILPAKEQLFSQFPVKPAHRSRLFPAEHPQNQECFLSEPWSPMESHFRVRRVGFPLLRSEACKPFQLCHCQCLGWVRGTCLGKSKQLPASTLTMWILLLLAQKNPSFHHMDWNVHVQITLQKGQAGITAAQPQWALAERNLVTATPRTSPVMLQRWFSSYFKLRKWI